MRGRALFGHTLTLVVSAAIAVGVLIVLFNLAGALSFGETHNVRVVVPQAGTLTKGTSVTMAGARIGTVQTVERHGVGAIVDVRIDDSSVWPLPKDSTAELAVRTPLGENYIKLHRGKSRENLPEDGIVGAAPGAEYVDIDELISILQGRTRNRAKKLIQGLGTAVKDRGPETRRTLHDVAGALDSGARLVRRLSDDREQVARLVRQVGDLANALADRRDAIVELASEGRATFAAVAQRDAAVRDLLRELPGTLRQVRATTQTLRAASASATPVVADLAASVADLRPGVRALAPAARDGRQIVARLSDAAPPLERTLASLRRAAPPLTEVMPNVKKVLCQANPVLRYTEPYIADLTSFLVSLGAAANSYDAIGHTIRLMPVVNESALLGAPKEVNDAVTTLKSLGLLQVATGWTFDPFPGPGEAESSFQPGDPILKGPADYAASGRKYERVTRDC
jgi:phospholipid/cholesterol/gamma-HCH transport system substrate-binding protein